MAKLIGITLLSLSLVGCSAHRRMMRTIAEHQETIDGKGCLCINMTGTSGFVGGNFTGFLSYGGIDPNVCVERC